MSERAIARPLGCLEIELDVETFTLPFCALDVTLLPLVGR